MSASAQRLFHVIVFGGIGLVELSVACDTEMTDSTFPDVAVGTAASTSGSFPTNGTVTTVGSGGSTVVRGEGGPGGAAAEDASRDVGAGGFAGFPMEGPPNPCPPNLPPCPPDAAEDRAPSDAADAAADAGRDSFPVEGPPGTTDR